MTQTTFPEIWAERQRNPPSLWDDQARQIIEALEALGIKRKDIDTIGYIFKFPYGNSVIEFTNHGKSLAGTIHKKPSSPLEESCLDDAEEILGTPRFSDAERLQFVREFQYKKFHYPGDPARLVADVIRIADTPVTSLPMDYLFRHG